MERTVPGGDVERDGIDARDGGHRARIEASGPDLRGEPREGTVDDPRGERPRGEALAEVEGRPVRRSLEPGDGLSVDQDLDPRSGRALRGGGRADLDGLYAREDLRGPGREEAESAPCGPSFRGRRGGGCAAPCRGR